MQSTQQEFYISKISKKEFEKGVTLSKFLKNIVQRKNANLKRTITKKGFKEFDEKKFTKLSRQELLKLLKESEAGVGLTGGGDCAGIADFLSSLALNLDSKLTMLGIKNAGAGLSVSPEKFKDQLIVVDKLLAEDFIGQSSTPFGSARVNAIKDFPENTINNLKPYNFVYGTGGDDHLGMLAEIAKKFPEKVVVGTFKSIDGDGCINGKPAQMLGFKTAMERFRQDFWAIVQNAYTHNQVHVVEFFGRKSGKLAFESARKFPLDFEDLPKEEKRKIEEFRDCVMILVPEKPTSLKKIVEKALEIKRSHGCCVIAVAEGFTPTDLPSEKNQCMDSFGNVATLSGVRHQIIRALKEQGKLSKVNELLCNYEARGATPSKWDSVMGKKIGKKAAELINKGTTGGKAIIYFEKMNPLKEDPVVVHLTDISNKNTLNNCTLYNDKILKENGVFYCR